MNSILKKSFLAITFFTINVCYVFPQTLQKNSVAVMNIDSKIPEASPSILCSIVRLELQKLNYFNVIDKYDAEYLIQKNQLQIEKCYGRMCMVEVGKALQVDKVIGG